jgi:hypothetical protein
MNISHTLQLKFKNELRIIWEWTVAKEAHSFYKTTPTVNFTFSLVQMAILCILNLGNKHDTTNDNSLQLVLKIIQICSWQISKQEWIKIVQRCWNLCRR